MEKSVTLKDVLNKSYLSNGLLVVYEKELDNFLDKNEKSKYQNLKEKLKSKFINEYMYHPYLADLIFRDYYLVVTLNENNDSFGLYFDYLRYAYNVAVFFLYPIFDCNDKKTNDAINKIFWETNSFSEEKITKCIRDCLKYVRSEVKKQNPKIINNFSSVGFEGYESEQNGFNKYGSRVDNLYLGLSPLKKMEEEITLAINRVLVNNKYVLNDLKENDISNMIELKTEEQKEKAEFFMNLKIFENIEQNKKTSTKVYSVINFYHNMKNKKNVDNLKVEIVDEETGIVKIYTFADFEKKLQDYILTHKDVNMDTLGDDYFKGWTPLEIKDFLQEFTNDTLRNFEEVNTNEVFLPYGKQEISEEKNTDSKKSRKSTEKESLLVLQKRLFYAKNINNIYKTLMGKDKFKGYVANIFKNGYVIFEKYDVKEENISTKPGAAYIMTIDKFNEFCRKTISEIREYVRNNPEGDVDFRTHRGNWQDYLQNIINRKTGISMDIINQEIKRG